MYFLNFKFINLSLTHTHTYIYIYIYTIWLNFDKSKKILDYNISKKNNFVEMISNQSDNSGVCVCLLCVCVQLNVG